MGQDSEVLQKKLSSMDNLQVGLLESMECFFIGTYTNLLLNN